MAEDATSSSSKKKIIAICQSGGEFETDKDGLLSYNGGEAYAVDIVHQQTLLPHFKKELSDTFQCSTPDAILLKYFLPGNKKRLITIAKEKDFQRMLNFYQDGDQVEVFLTIQEPPPSNNNNDVFFNATPTANRTMTTESAVLPVNTFSADDPIYMDLVMDTQALDASNYNGDKHLKVASQWENIITGVDQRFHSFPEFREALRKYSIAHGFGYKYKKNDSLRVTVRCKSESCPWRLYASRLPSSQLVCIKKMNEEHTCERGATKAGYRATRGWVGSIIKEKLKDSPSYKPKDIATDIKREYGIELNYTQAWRAKEMVRGQMQGSYAEAYSQLPYYCEKIMETNPGSVATFATNEDSSFRRLFVSFHASISGFKQGCRPLIFLDSAPLYSKYQGTLLAAISADAEDDAFPVAFAVVDVETDDNWHWFLSELKSAISTSEVITFVADFQKGLRESLPEVFENCHHAYCLRYLAEKLSDDLKTQFSHEARRLMVQDMYTAAFAHKHEEFEQCTENIKIISPEAYNWVLQSEPGHWANAYFEGSRYNLLTANFGELFYGWVAEVNELPITQMVDALRGKMMEMIYTRRVHSSDWGTRLAPSVEEKLQVDTSKFQVVQSQGNTYEVHGQDESVVDLVDMDNWDCSCKGWQLSGLPCSHAVAVIEGLGRTTFDYCSRYLTTESYRLTYAESIQPVPNVEAPMMSESAPVTITPPSKRPPGRPKMKPAGVMDVIKRQLQCSKCKGIGHNKRRCDMVQMANGTSDSLTLMSSPTS